MVWLGNSLKPDLHILPEQPWNCLEMQSPGSRQPKLCFFTLAGSMGRWHDLVCLVTSLWGCRWLPSKFCSLPRTLTTAQRLTGFCVLPELQQFYATQSRLPDSRVVLCFGEEFPDTAPLRSKLILVQVRASGFSLVSRHPHPHLYGPTLSQGEKRQQGLQIPPV